MDGTVTAPTAPEVALPEGRSAADGTRRSRRPATGVVLLNLGTPEGTSYWPCGAICPSSSRTGG